MFDQNELNVTVSLVKVPPESIIFNLNLLMGSNRSLISFKIL